MSLVILHSATLEHTSSDVNTRTLLAAQPQPFLWCSFSSSASPSSLSLSAIKEVDMASIISNLPPPAFLVPNRNTLFKTLQKLPVSPVRERQNRAAIIVKAAGESSESSTSLSIVKSVQNVWDNSEDRLALFGLGFAAIVALWASANLVTAIDKLPLIPTVLELVGILYSSWFIYRYLLFKPDREELFQIVNKSVSDILGQ